MTELVGSDCNTHQRRQPAHPVVDNHNGTTTRQQCHLRPRRRLRTPEPHPFQLRVSSNNRSKRLSELGVVTCRTQQHTQTTNPQPTRNPRCGQHHHRRRNTNCQQSGRRPCHVHAEPNSKQRLERDRPVAARNTNMRGTGIASPQTSNTKTASHDRHRSGERPGHTPTRRARENIRPVPQLATATSRDQRGGVRTPVTGNVSCGKNPHREPVPASRNGIAHTPETAAFNPCRTQHRQRAPASDIRAAGHCLRPRCHNSDRNDDRGRRRPSRRQRHRGDHDSTRPQNPSPTSSNKTGQASSSSGGFRRRDRPAPPVRAAPSRRQRRHTPTFSWPQTPNDTTTRNLHNEAHSRTGPAPHSANP